MKLRGSIGVFCVFAIVLTAFAQTPAHESAIDGRWVATVATSSGEEVTQFTFKNVAGEVNGTVTEGEAQPLEIKNGRLDGINLTFAALLNRVGAAERVMVTWTGTIEDGAKSIKLSRSASDDGKGALPKEVEAKRVP